MRQDELSKVSLFIEVPQNRLVFDNLSSVVYDALWNHFDRVGYDLVKSSTNTSVANTSVANTSALRVTIKKVDSPDKFLSPDLLVYAVKTRVELLCELFDAGDKLVAKKLFVMSCLISKAKDHVVNSNFYDYKYKKLFERYAPKIDHYFRPFLLKTNL